MDRIDKRKRQIEKDAVNFLLAEVYDGDENLCPSYLRVSITARNKKDDPSFYEENLKTFKALFHSDNDNYKIALWNGLVRDLRYCDEKLKFCREDFSKEEFAFIKAAIKAINNQNYWEVNVNTAIETDRLVLRGIEKSDCNLFAYHYKHDGDFILFTGFNATSKLIKNYANRRCPTFFTIEEKDSHKVIGYIGLSIMFASATGLIEYYIFKEYRNQGYCKEATKKLVDMTIRGKLYEPKRMVQECVYNKKSVKLNAIRARISVVNTASIKLVESCGFICEATIHKTVHNVGLGWTDEKIYYITSEQV